MVENFDVSLSSSFIRKKRQQERECGFYIQFRRCNVLRLKCEWMRDWCNGSCWWCRRCVNSVGGVYSVTGIRLESGAREETGRFRDVKRCVATGDRTRISGIGLLRHNRSTIPPDRATELLTCFRVPVTLSSSPALGIPLEPPNHPLLPV